MNAVNPPAPPFRAGRRRPPRPAPEMAGPLSPSDLTTSLYGNLGKLDWRDLELFLTLADAGSIRRGATETGCGIRTARQRLSRIEDVLGQCLALRDPDGLKLTEAGEIVHALGQKMRISREAEARRKMAEEARKPMRIAITEGLGSFWVAPRIVEFQEANPDLTVRLFCDMQRVDLSDGGFDVAIQLEPPASTALLGIRVGTLHLMPFAAESYLRIAGVPASVDDWPRHRLVWQEADQVASHLLPYHIGTQDPGSLIAITTNSSSAHFRAVATGAGIGLLPTYARAISRKVRPLDIGIRLKREIFCVVEASRASLPQIIRMTDWLTSAFSGHAYPWFRDQFVHPNDFENDLASGDVVGMFEGFIDPSEP
ncbi:MAG TPA: LysR family transcriptional regulator [Sphingobium sp.]|uniref:LysR family transcriptional regulator n=1 Tax=Sphingobium sp. TaxID=1912891 RepID=UPI002ED0A98E